jgi:ketosteroid isomerase-like protein
MAARDVETYRAGHQAFNQRDFEAMTRRYADSITWTDHAQVRTFNTPQEFRDDFLAGWIRASSDIRITNPRYIDAGHTVVCTFTVVGTTTGRSARSLLAARGSPCRSARCGTSTPAGA